MRNLFADLHEMPGIESNLEGIASPATLKEAAVGASTEEVFANGNRAAKSDDCDKLPPSPNGGLIQSSNSAASVGKQTKPNPKQSHDKGDKDDASSHDVRRSSRHDKDLQQYMKVNQNNPNLDQANILPSLRRSNRSNKGISREVFDPSHIPSPKSRISVSVPQQYHSVMDSAELRATKGTETGKAEQTKQSKEKMPIARKDKKGRRKEDEENEDEQTDSESESDDDGYNDPNRLWCICRKPHSDRFMISCDTCEEWFHGDCVGITVQRGKQMEKRGEEYVCPSCIKNKGKRKKQGQQTVRPSSKSKSGVSLKGYAHDKSGKSPKKLEKTEGVKRRKSHEGTEKKRGSNEHHPIKGSSMPKRRKCIVSACGNEAQADSVYCSNVCILRHAKESLAKGKKEEKGPSQRLTTDARQETKEERILRKIREASTKGKVAVYCYKTGKIFSNNSAPLKEELDAFLKRNPTFRQLRLKKHKHTDAVRSSADLSKKKSQDHKRADIYTQDPDYKPEVVKPSNPYKPQIVNPGREDQHKTKKHKIERQESNEHKKSKQRKISEQERRQSTEKFQKVAPNKRENRSLSDDKPEMKKELTPQKEKEIRKSVQKTLLGILQNRSNNSKDLKMHPESTSKLVNKIEDSLYKLFGGVSSKYKNRYRSITFNLKDEKNEGLWRKVILGQITSSSLVKMTAEEMASKELAQWRKHELTQELEMIHELEVAKQNIRPVSKITHKGEIAINEDLTDLTEAHLDAAHEVAPSVAPQRVRRVSANQPEPATDSESPSSDTTAEHSNHLFDMNCRICTGQIKEEEALLEDSLHKAVKRSTSIILSNEAQTNEKEQSDEEILKKITAFNKKQEKFVAMPQKHETSERGQDKADEPHSPEEDIISKIEEKLAKVESTRDEEAKDDIITDPAALTTYKLSREHFLWTGVISMPELSSFHTNAYTVSGNTKGLANTISSKLVLDGRIHPRVVWDYLAKVSTFPNKEVCVIQFRASSEDDRVGYISMLSYFSSRQRFGVVSNQNTQVIKDIYLVPLLETENVPKQLLPFRGPGLPEEHPSMLLGVIVRCMQEPQRRRSSPEVDTSSSKNEEKHKNHRQEEGTSDQHKKSLLDRNKSLAVIMPSHFTMKEPGSPEKTGLAEEEEYNPETADFADIVDDDDPQDHGIPQGAVAVADEDEEAYDPEKLVFDDPEDDDVPYDPELDAERLETSELKALQEKQALLEKMKQELDMKKAELAKEEMSLQQQSPTPPPPPPPPTIVPLPAMKVSSQPRADPRIAARIKSQKAPASDTNSTAASSETALQTIYSVLNLDRSKNT